MVGVDRLDHHVADRERSPAAIRRVGQARDSTTGRAGAGRRNLGHAVDHPQRADVEMVVVGVGEQHEVDAGQMLRLAAGATRRST